MSQYVNNREACGRSIIKIRKFSKSITDATSDAEITVHLKVLETKWKKYQEFHHQILSVTGKEEIDAQIDVELVMEEMYIATRSALITERDRVATKYQNPEDVRNAAEKRSNNLSISDSNFTLAWNTLTSRFENLRHLTTILLSNILDAPSVKNGSAAELRKLMDDAAANVNQLGDLDYPTDEWDVILTFIFVRKLDSDTRRQWELQIDSNDYPKWNELTTFVYNRCRSLELLDNEYDSRHHMKERRPASAKRFVKAFVSRTANNYRDCSICNQSGHRLHKCPVYTSWDVGKRREYVEANRLCTNCLNGHTSPCKSPWRCTICNEPHHSSIHSNSSTSTITSAHISSHNLSTPHYNVMLATAIIHINTNSGTIERVRALIDQGSQCSFITESLVQRLSLNKHRTTVSTAGIGSANSDSVRNLVQFTFKSAIDSSLEFDCSALVIRKITGYLPSTSFKSEIKLPSGICLADPEFNISNSIDVLLGADLSGSILKSGLLSTNIKGLVAQNTALGWILSGPLQNQLSHPQPSNLLIINTLHVTLNGINNSLKRFWEIEELSSTVLPMTQEDKMCEEHFNHTHTRREDGRFVVQLPFKEPKPILGTSIQRAIVRFNQVEKRLTNYPDVKLEYMNFMEQYEELGHMKTVATDDSSKVNYYIQHHHVSKPDSSTTKLRVVFDASARTSTGVSLNNCLMIGPKLQDDLVSILLRWRHHKYVFTADVEKMYRQILVSESDTSYQRIVYRSAPTDPITEYKLLTVTYGTSAAPYLAVKFLQRLARDESTKFPRASEVALTNFYVDDLMSGSNTIPEALNLQRDLIELLKLGKFNLRKWSANNTKLLNSIPQDQRETQQLNI